MERAELLAAVRGARARASPLRATEAPQIDWLRSQPRGARGAALQQLPPHLCFAALFGAELADSLQPAPPPPPPHPR